MPRSALEPVSEAVYATLNVSALTDLATGGLFESVPQDPSFPLVWWTLRESDTAGTFGQVFKSVELNVNVFSAYRGGQEAQQIVNKVVALLRGASLSLSNHTSLQVTHESSRALPDKKDAAGVLLKHYVAEFELLVAED